MGKAIEHDREKRRFDRKQLLYYVKVFSSKDNTLFGYLADISVEGLMLFSRKEVEVNKRFDFRIDLDKEFDLEGSLAFEVQSIWCRPDANPEYHIIGFEFSNLDASRIDTLKYLIQKYGFDK